MIETKEQLLEFNKMLGGIMEGYKGDINKFALDLYKSFNKTGVCCELIGNSKHNTKIYFYNVVNKVEKTYTLIEYNIINSTVADINIYSCANNSKSHFLIVRNRGRIIVGTFTRLPNGTSFIWDKDGGMRYEPGKVSIGIVESILKNIK